jgi:hypothetical protein
MTGFVHCQDLVFMRLLIASAKPFSMTKSNVMLTKNARNSQSIMSFLPVFSTCSFPRPGGRTPRQCPRSYDNCINGSLFGRVLLAVRGRRGYILDIIAWSWDEWCSRTWSSHTFCNQLQPGPNCNDSWFMSQNQQVDTSGQPHTNLNTKYRTSYRTSQGPRMRRSSINPKKISQTQEIEPRAHVPYPVARLWIY